jgi:hypothetical protein
VDLYEAYQLLAARAILLPDREAWYRHVCRWYSKTFHTPLHEVQDLPTEFVLQNYYEGAIEEMDAEHRAEFLEDVTLTDEERKQRKVEESQVEKVDEDFFEKLNAEVKADQMKGPPKENRKAKALRKAALDQVAKRLGGPVVDAAPESKDLGPGFSTSFGGNLLDEMGDFDPLAPPPRKK